MALIEDKLLVKVADIPKNRDISANMDAGRIEPFIREAQNVEAIRILGPELWKVLYDDYDNDLDTFATPKYTDLWKGTDSVTIDGVAVLFQGLKEAITYYTYARVLTNNSLNVTRFGNKHMIRDESEDEINPQIRTKSADARAMALKYEKETIAFLEEKRSDYTEWISITRTSNKSFEFFRV